MVNRKTLTIPNIAEIDIPLPAVLTGIIGGYSIPDALDFLSEGSKEERLMVASICGRVDEIKELIDKTSFDKRLLVKMLKRCVKFGDLWIVKFLRKRGVTMKDVEMESFSLDGKIDAKVFQDDDDKFHPDIFFSIVQNDRFDCLKEFLDNWNIYTPRRGTQDLYHIIDLCGEFGNIRCFQETIKHFPEGKFDFYDDDCSLIYNVCTFGNIDMFEMLEKDYKITIDHLVDGNALQAAASYNQIQMLQVLRSRGLTGDHVKKLSVSKVVTSAYYSPCNLFYIIARKGYSDVLKEFRSGWGLTLGDILYDEMIIEIMFAKKRYQCIEELNNWVKSKGDFDRLTEVISKYQARFSRD